MKLIQCVEFWLGIVKAAIAINGLGILGFDYSRSQNQRIPGENSYF